MKRVRNALILATLIWGVAQAPALRPLAAQSAAQVSSAETWPQADPEDVASMDAIIAALYDVISGPAGEARDWDRFRSLFVPQARLIPTGRNQEGGFGYRVWSPDEYASQAGRSLEQNGFFEIEIARTTERFGQVAHAFSTYESRSKEDDAEPFARGINSIQILHDGDRWWIIDVFWAAERPDLSIPERYLTDRP